MGRNIPLFWSGRTVEQACGKSVVEMRLADGLARGSTILLRLAGQLAKRQGDTFGIQCDFTW